MLDTSDEEVQFSFSPPLLPVTTAGRTLAFDLSGESICRLVGFDQSGESIRRLV